MAGVANLPQFKKTANSRSGNALGGDHIHLCMGGGAQCAAPLEPAGIITGHELKDLSGSKNLIKSVKRLSLTPRGFDRGAN